MEKRKRKCLMLFVCILVLSLHAGASVSAKSKDVTKKYKSEVTKMLAPFDRYLCYPMTYGKATGKFVFNDYTKTSMIIYSPIITAYSCEKVDSVKKKCLPKMKLYFGSNAKFKLKKYRGYQVDNKLHYLFKNNNGRIVYTGGDYSPRDIPKGKVTKILQTSKNRYTVTYKEYLTNDYFGYPRQYRGTYQIYLKKASNTMGFIITNIKLISSAEWKHWK